MSYDYGTCVRCGWRIDLAAERDLRDGLGLPQGSLGVSYHHDRLQYQHGQDWQCLAAAVLARGPST